MVIKKIISSASIIKICYNLYIGGARMNKSIIRNLLIYGFIFMFITASPIINFAKSLPTDNIITTEDILGYLSYDDINGFYLYCGPGVTYYLYGDNSTWKQFVGIKIKVMGIVSDTSIEVIDIEIPIVSYGYLKKIEDRYSLLNLTTYERKYYLANSTAEWDPYVGTGMMVTGLIKGIYPDTIYVNKLQIIPQPKPPKTTTTTITTKTTKTTNIKK